MTRTDAPSPTSSGVDIGERLFENNVRIDWVVPLAGIQSPLCELLHDFVHDADEHEWRMLKDRMPTVVRYFDNEDDFERYEVDDLFIEGAIADRLAGFLIRASFPVPTSRCGSGFVLSWGYTQFATLYGDTIEAAMEAALSWAIAGWEKACAELSNEKEAVNG